MRVAHRSVEFLATGPHSPGACVWVPPDGRWSAVWVFWALLTAEPWIAAYYPALCLPATPRSPDPPVWYAIEGPLGGG